MKSIGLIANSTPEIWCTSDQAERLTGFSRQYMTALLDSEDFAGQVQIRSDGYRRVKKEAVESWMKSHGVICKKVSFQNLSQNTPLEFLDEPKFTPLEIIDAKARIEIENEESRKYHSAMLRPLED